MKQNAWNLQNIRNHGYVILSVILWGLTQFFIDRLLVFFSPVLLIFLRFFFSGLILVGTFNREKVKIHFIYIITGGLGAFGYYILIEYALIVTSIPFIAIMGGVLPFIAIVFDAVLEKKQADRMQVIAAVITLFGIYLFSFQAKFKWNLTGIILMILANVSWVLYIHIKKGLHTQNEMTELGFEFISAGLLTIPFGSSFHILKPLNAVALADLMLIIVFATIIPYVLYLKGSSLLSLSTSSLYLNFLPVTSLIPSFLLGRLELNSVQILGICVLVLSVFLGNIRKRLPDIFLG